MEKRLSQDNRPTDTNGRLVTVDGAMTTLLTALRDVDNDVGLILEVVSAWGDLSFDDRRYVGNAFPRLTNALLAIEDHLG